MSDDLTFAVWDDPQLEERGDDSGDTRPQLVARMIPWNVVGRTARGPERFERGGLTIPEGGVPLYVDSGGEAGIHGRRGVLDIVGRLVDSEDRADGLYGTFDFAPTPTAEATRALLRGEFVESVSVGFIPGAKEGRDGDTTIVLASHPATLDHLAVVHRGAYQGAAAIAVRSNPGGDMADETTETAESVDQVEDRSAAVDVVTAEALEATEDRVRSLEALVAALAEGRPVETEERRRPAGEIVHLILRGQRGDQRAEAELRALAQDSTTTATGIVPDYYSREIISIIDTARPFVADLDSDPAGDYGMDVIYPKVTQKPTAAKQTAEHAEVASQQFTIGTQTVTLDTFAGANEVSVQTIDRSNPSFLEAFYRELAGIYAQETEQEAEADVLAAVGIGTSVLATTATLAQTVTGLVDAAVGIAKAVKRMPTHLWASPDRWGQLAKLTDADGRPVFPWADNGPVNALGQLNLRTPDGQVAALRLRMVPNFATGTLLMGWDGAAATLEVPNQQLRALQVSTLAWELGVYGYFATAVKYAGGFHSFTTV